MRACAAIGILSLLPVTLAAAKLTFEDRVELIRGLVAEYATAKALIPHAKKTLEFDADGSYDKNLWAETARDSGPAARAGDRVQVTKIDIGSDRIVLQINGGYGGGRKWYRNAQVSAGPNSRPVTAPVAAGDVNAPGGASIALLFHKPLESIKADEIKKILAPILDFDKRSAAEVYSEAMPPEVKQAIEKGRVVVGMNRDEVVMSMGHPVYRSRETKDGVDYEDWVYGRAPGKITLVTFTGDKVVKVKEEYAGPGAQVGGPPQ
ncbi:MAG: hypothetical protein ABSC23_05480 [Bryobacteraceae bacterium]|jgi:hypothetical protein